MSKITTVSKNPNLEIGKVYKGLATGPYNEPRPEQCFKVIAYATEQDWVEYLSTLSPNLRDHFETMIKMNGPWFYYKIQTD